MEHITLETVTDTIEWRVKGIPNALHKKFEVLCMLQDVSMEEQLSRLLYYAVEEGEYHNQIPDILKVIDHLTTDPPSVAQAKIDKVLQEARDRDAEANKQEIF